MRVGRFFFDGYAITTTAIAVQANQFVFLMGKGSIKTPELSQQVVYFYDKGAITSDGDFNYLILKILWDVTVVQVAVEPLRVAATTEPVAPLVAINSRYSIGWRTWNSPMGKNALIGLR
jgi:hypothetical protein